MSETIKWATNEFQAGDQLIAPFDPRVITIVDIYQADTTEVGVYVVLEIGETEKILIPSDEFAYRVDAGQLKRFVTPLFEVGDRFIHRANNDTVTILAAGNRPDWKGEVHYFVHLSNEYGDVSFTSVNEKYLAGCLRYPGLAPKFVFPDIEMDAVFPSIIPL